MDGHRATWTPSSVRRNCDFCVKKKVKCPGDQDGKGCLYCQKKSVRCHYSVKQKPGPKCKKRKVQDLGPATEGTEAPKDSSTPQRQQQHPLVTGVAGSKRGLDTGDRDDYADNVGVECGSPLMASSSPSMPPLRLFKKPKTTHDEGYSSARQHGEDEHKCKKVPLQPKPAPLREWLSGSGEDDSRPVSVHSGGGAPLTLPLFYGVSPTSWTLVTHRAPGDDCLGGARLDSSAGTFGVQRAFSGGAQLFKTAIEPGGNLDGAGGGRAGPVHTGDIFGNGGSFVFGFKGEEPSMEELLGLLNPLDSLIDQDISGDSDASSDSSAAYDDEFVRQMARIRAFWRNQKSAPRGRSEIMSEIGVDRSRQSESLSGCAPSGGGGGRVRGVRNDFSLDDSEVILAFGESLLPEMGSGDGEEFRGVAVNASHPEHPPPITAFPLAVDAPVGSASVQGAMSEHTGIGFGTNANRGSSSHQHDSGGSEGHSSLFDPYAYDLSHGQLSLGDRSCTDDVMNNYLVFLGGECW